MKVIAALFILLFSFSWANAQTKEETEKWIVDKVNQLMSKKTRIEQFKDEGIILSHYQYDYLPSKFSIQDGRILILYNYIRSSFDGKNKTQLENINYAVSADIYSIDNASKFGMTSGDPKITLYGDLNYLVIRLTCTCAIRLANTSNQGEKDFYVPLFIDPNAESDIISRLNKAFEHLKSFYPKPKEIF